MKKFFFLAMVAVFVLAFSSIALAEHDVDQPGDLDPDCLACHGPVEDNFVEGITHTGNTTQALTLRNIIRFENQYALKVFKVEDSTSTSSTAPILDLGTVQPDVTASGKFWTHVFSNAPYTETFTWTDFSDGAGSIPAARMTVGVTDGGVTLPVANGGIHLGGAHGATPNDGNWERVDLTVDTEWGDPVGGSWTSTLDIVVAQQ